MFCWLALYHSMIAFANSPIYLLGGTPSYFQQIIGLNIHSLFFTIFTNVLDTIIQMILIP